MQTNLMKSHPLLTNHAISPEQSSGSIRLTGVELDILVLHVFTDRRAIWSNSLSLYTAASLSVISYNCKGFNSSVDYLRETIVNSDPLFVCLQETWHLASNASVFAAISDNYMFYETSGVDCSQDIIMGRPYGGLAILYKRCIADKVKMVKTSNRRLCVLQIHYEGCPGAYAGFSEGGCREGGGGVPRSAKEANNPILLKVQSLQLSFRPAGVSLGGGGGGPRPPLAPPPCVRPCCLPILIVNVYLLRIYCAE